MKISESRTVITMLAEETEMPTRPFVPSVRVASRRSSILINSLRSLTSFKMIIINIFVKIINKLIILSAIHYFETILWNIIFQQSSGKVTRKSEHYNYNRKQLYHTFISILYLTVYIEIYFYHLYISCIIEFHKSVGI